MWRGREGVPEFDATDSRSVKDLNVAIDEMIKDNGEQWDTFVVDSMTVIYHTIFRKWSTLLESKKESPWVKVNQEMRDIYNRLMDIPHQNVIVIAREATKYQSKPGFFEAVGVKPELDDDCRYVFDYTMHLTSAGKGILEDQRGFIIAGGNNEIPFNWNTFEPAANAYVKDGVAAPELPSEADTIRADMARQQRTIPVPEIV